MDRYCDRFCGQPNALLIPHFVLTSPSILFLAGDIVKLNLPESMTLLFLNGTDVIGTQSATETTRTNWYPSSFRSTVYHLFLTPLLHLCHSPSLPPLFRVCTPAHADCPRDGEGELYYPNAGAVDILRQWQATQ